MDFNTSTANIVRRAIDVSTSTSDGNQVLAFFQFLVDHLALILVPIGFFVVLGIFVKKTEFAPLITSFAKVIDACAKLINSVIKLFDVIVETLKIPNDAIRQYMQFKRADKTVETTDQISKINDFKKGYAPAREILGPEKMRSEESQEAAEKAPDELAPRRRRPREPRPAGDDPPVGGG